MAVNKHIGTMNLERSWPYGDNTWKPGMDRNLQKLSTMTMPSVISRTAVVPETGVAGNVYIDPDNGLILMWDVDSDDDVAKWLAIQPLEPTLVWVEDEELFVTWTDVPAQWNVMFDPATAIPVPETRAVAMFFPGDVPPVAKLFIMAVRVSFDLPASFAGSQGYAEVPPSGGDVTFTLQKNGTGVADITFANGSNATTFNSGALSFVEGDILTIVSPSNLYGLSTVALTLKGTVPGL